VVVGLPSAEACAACRCHKCWPCRHARHSRLDRPRRRPQAQPLGPVHRLPWVNARWVVRKTMEIAATETNR
jgi:hypothetical protein